MKIYNTKDVHFKPSYICIYGVSGIGKTSLAKTLPHEEILFLDAESGIASLRDTNIDVISLAKDDNGALIPEEHRLDRLTEFNQFIRTPEVMKKYKYIFIDSLTEISQNIMKQMQKKYTGFQAWGEYSNAMIHLMKFYRDIGHYTIIFTALEGRLDDDQGTSFAYPDVGGKKAKEYLLPAFDEVFRMVVDTERNRLLVTSPTSKSQAKDRSGKLSSTEEPNLGKILQKIKGVETNV
jgi:phage nucleotide-binding protein